MNAETVAATVSPTGHQALRRIAATGPVGARTDSIHAATRSALDGRGLIVYTADGRGRPGGLVWLTGPSSAGPFHDALGRRRSGGGVGAQAFTSIPSGDIGWVIVGGESGPKHRPLDLDHARSVRDQCAQAGVPFFFKQVGGRTPTAGGDLLDGVRHKEFPRESMIPWNGQAAAADRGRDGGDR